MALTPEEADELLRLAPEDLWRRLTKILRDQKGMRGTGRKVVIELGLDDTRGTVSPAHSWITPPRVPIKPD